MLKIPYAGCIGLSPAISTHITLKMYVAVRNREEFTKMVNNKDHCIHQLLPPKKILPMKLRATNCIFALPQCHYNLYKHSFVLRYLFGGAY